MSTATEAAPATATLAGDVCPPWCGDNHRVDRGPRDHEEDRGVLHEGNPIDSWTPPGGTAPLEIWVLGYRHDNDDDWPDTVRADRTDPGNLGGIELPAADARRLGEALIQGSAMLTAGQREREHESADCPWWCAGSDGDHDHTAEAGGDQWPTIRPSAFSTQDMTVTAFPTWAVSEGTPPDVSLWVQFRQRGISGGPDEIEAAMTPDEALALAQQLMRAAYAAKGATRDH